MGDHEMVNDCVFAPMAMAFPFMQNKSCLFAISSQIKYLTADAILVKINHSPGF